jgi:MFS family permease
MHTQTQTREILPVLITLAMATLTASMGISVASVLLPTLTDSFSATISDVQWVVLVYLMSVTMMIVSAGQLGDLFGHRRVLVSGLLVFVAASLLSAMATSLAQLIAGRALQGLGGAILIALPMSIARDMVPTKQLGTAMGILGTTSAVGTALGPSLGGILLFWSDWRMAFWLLAGFAGIALALSITSLPRASEQKTASFRQMDFPGTFVLAIALAAYALATSGGASGIPASPGLLIIIALITITLFVIIETRTSSPLVPMTLLQDRRTGLGFLMNLLVGTVMMSTLVVGPFYLAFSMGLNEALVGLVMAVGPVVAALSGIPAGQLTDRLGAKRVMLIGLVQTISGLLCLAFLPDYFGVGGYVIALILLTPAFQLFLAANNTAVLVDASKEQRGRISGLLGLSRNLGLMTGASAMPALFVVFLGTGDVSRAGITKIADAFSMTFAIAAALALITLLLAIYSQTDRKPVQDFG